MEALKVKRTQTGLRGLALEEEERRRARKTSRAKQGETRVEPRYAGTE